MLGQKRNQSMFSPTEPGQAAAPDGRWAVTDPYEQPPEPPAREQSPPQEEPPAPARRPQRRAGGGRGAEEFQTEPGAIPGGGTWEPDEPLPAPAPPRQRQRRQPPPPAAPAGVQPQDFRFDESSAAAEEPLLPPTAARWSRPDPRPTQTLEYGMEEGPPPPAPRRPQAPQPPPSETPDEEAFDYGRGLSTGEGKLRTHSLFFTPTGGGADFSSVLHEVQEYISSKYSKLITDGGTEETKSQIKRYITKYVQDRRLAVEGMTSEQLIDALYGEMAEYSFLTKYIFGAGQKIEEINLNSWRDCEVQYASGEHTKLDEHFDSPEHAINVIRRMLHVSGMVLDNASPAVLGHLSKNIRIAVLKTPLVDEDVGISASIRIVNPQSMTKEDFVGGGTATDTEMELLATCLRYGISICIAGSTGSGKTTLAGWMLTTIPNNKRLFTIENGSRELDLVREQDGRVVNSVIHTITRPSENDSQNIDQDMLLDMALRYHPDIICVGEMRSYEAYTAQEAARTGHSVLTTVHSNSCEATWRRMVTLCKRKYDMGDDTLMDLVTEAFPIVVFAKQLENKQRKIMEIMECEILPDGGRQYNTIYRYQITENHMADGKFHISGYHEMVRPISQSLQKRLVENGMPSDTLEQLLQGMAADQRKEEHAG